MTSSDDQARRERSSVPHSVVLAINSDYRLYRFRRVLINELLNHGSLVYGVAPRERFAEKLEEIGVRFRHWGMSRTSVNPIRDAVSVGMAFRLMRKIRPTLCHTFTLKPNIYGVIAARLAGIPVIVSTYTGLGHVFTQIDGATSSVQRVVRPLVRLASSLSDAVIFQNSDDMELMLELGLVSKSKTRLIPGGSGVTLDEFSPTGGQDCTLRRLRLQLKITDGSMVMLLGGRMLFSKGVREYVECARELRARGLHVRSFLVGGTDADNPAAISTRQLQRWSDQGYVEYLGEREDIANLLRLADIVVLPSYYREGVPRILLEAAATGKPIVTTDAPGCRDVVDHGVNGLLVAPRDVGSLTNAVERLASDQEYRERLGRASRKKALQEFDERKVVSDTLSLYSELLARKGT